MLQRPINLHIYKVWRHPRLCVPGWTGLTCNHAMSSFPLRPLSRPSWRAVAIVALTFVGCARLPTEPVHALVRQVLPTPDGAVIVFTPSTCALRARTFQALGRLDGVPGASVIGIVTRLDEPSDSLAAVATEFGASFPLSLDTNGTWTKSIIGSGLPEPLLIIVRHGTIVAYLGGELLRDWQGEIPGFRGRTLGEEDFGR